MSRLDTCFGFSNPMSTASSVVAFEPAPFFTHVRLANPLEEQSSFGELAPIEDRTRSFFRARAQDRLHLAATLRFSVLYSTSCTMILSRILDSASLVRAEDRVSKTADLITLLDVDLIEFLRNLGLGSWQSGLKSLDTDIRAAMFLAMSRNDTPVYRVFLEAVVIFALSEVSAADKHAFLVMQLDLIFALARNDDDAFAIEQLMSLRSSTAYPKAAHAAVAIIGEIVGS